ncbi:MAG: hypothetical protein FWH36_06325 [Lentimicrobiaceae bacterium]|nr:hypothetical protein [Lentimicrobiaceae bacterium]
MGAVTRRTIFAENYRLYFVIDADRIKYKIIIEKYSMFVTEFIHFENIPTKERYDRIESARNSFVFSSKKLSHTINSGIKPGRLQKAGSSPLTT